MDLNSNYVLEIIGVLHTPILYLSNEDFKVGGLDDDSSGIEFMVL